MSEHYDLSNASGSSTGRKGYKNPTAFPSGFSKFNLYSATQSICSPSPFSSLSSPPSPSPSRPPPSLPAMMTLLVVSASSSTPPCAVSPAPSTIFVRLAFDDSFLPVADIVPRNFERSYNAPLIHLVVSPLTYSRALFFSFLVVFHSS
jgi:hypothetical protein